MRIHDTIELLEVAENRAMCPVLIHDGEKAILVDACVPGLHDAIAAAIEASGIPMSRVTTLFFTHQDIDHIGSAKELLAAHPSIEPAAHEDEIPYIDGSRIPAKLEAAQAAYPTMSAEDRAAFDRRIADWRTRVVPIARALRDGDVLPVAGGVEVIHTPGHTPGHACLYVRAAKALITGDAMNRNADGLTGPNPVHTKDMTLALRSLEKFRSYDIDKVICYHGGLFEGDFRMALDALLG